MTERRVTITHEQIADYAEASGDRNPIHLDDEFARSVGLPGVIAHGMLLMGLMATTVGHPAELRKIAVRFGGIVVPGDTITFSVDGSQLSAVNQRGEAVLTKATADYAP